MRTAKEIEGKIRDAMLQAVNKEQMNLTSLEKENYEIIMHGIGVSVIKKKTK